MVSYTTEGILVAIESHLSTTISSRPEDLLLGLRSLGGIQSDHLKERHSKCGQQTFGRTQETERILTSSLGRSWYSLAMVRICRAMFSISSWPVMKTRISSLVQKRVLGSVKYYNVYGGGWSKPSRGLRVDCENSWQHGTKPVFLWFRYMPEKWLVTPFKENFTVCTWHWQHVACLLHRELGSPSNVQTCQHPL